MIADLGTLGYSLSASRESLLFGQEIPTPQHEHRKFFHTAHAKVHAGLLEPQLEAIIATEKRFGSEIFVDGESLELGRIDPFLRPVNLRASDVSPRDKAVVEYVRSYQTVGSRLSVGKENVYILEDCGQSTRAVMGVLVLASPRYYQSRRDEVLGWLLPKQIRSLGDKTRDEHKAIRLAGLDRMMHVAICCALPPYAELGTARLLAIAPFTKMVRDDYSERWPRPDSDLAIVTTTTSMGKTGVPFQALRRGKFVDPENGALLGEKWNRDGKLYSRLGNTHPWRPDVALRSPEIFARFERLVSAETYQKARILVGSGLGEVSDAKILERALTALGLSRRMLFGNPLGYFIGALDRQSIEAVASGEPRSKRPLLDWHIAVQQFRSDFGEAVEPTKKPGVDAEQRAKAIENRRKRARKVRRDKILLSERILAELRGEPTHDEDSAT